MAVRSEVVWLVAGSAYGGAVLVVAALLIAGHGDLPDEFFALALPVAAAAAPFVLALAAWSDPDPERPETGVLNRLVALRRAHRLPPAGRLRPRRPGRWPVRESPEPPQPALAGALNRLVQRRREWAGPPADGRDAAAPAPAPHPDNGPEHSPARG